MSRSLFVTLDGLDGTGKSTQCRLLADWLRGLGEVVQVCSDPGGTEVGKILRTLVLEHKGSISMPCEALVFMASRAQLVSEIIRPALTRGEVVVCDRFQLATVVYQGHAGGLDIDLLLRLGQFVTGGLQPDLTIVLDLEPSLASTRLSGPRDRLESRPTEYQQRVREGFLFEARAQPQRMSVVDAGGSVDQVQAAVRELVMAHLENKRE